MTDIQAPEGGGYVTAINSPDVQSAGAGVLAAVNLPSELMTSTEAGIAVTYRKSALVAVTQAGILAAVRGRAANPVVRAWTFSLDGHDFYVLRLGDFFTFVYDLYSEQWVDWSSRNSPTWRANCGMNWAGGQGLALGYGSDVVVGDDNYGLLWFLNPDRPFDEHPDYLAPEQELYFDRITMGQMPMTGRNVLPCYAVWLTTDMGAPAYEGAGVLLEISDDGGKSWEDQGYITVTPDQFTTPELSWYSLGQIEAPGRLFRITDDGAVARIDSMEMNDPDDEK